MLALCTLPAVAQPRPANTAATCELEGGEDRTVTRVVDGETLLLDGGSEVRLIGALAPRGFDSAGGTGDWPLEGRAREALDRLVASRGVRLAFAGRRTDRYGRLLAHVFSGAEGGRAWVQGEMLKLGLARAYALDGSAHCLAELIAHEAVARDARTGIWAETAYAVRSADDTAGLLRHAGTFQLVEGKVLGVSDVRGTAYINFGEDWRQDFTVVVRTAGRRSGAGSQPGLVTDALVGRTIRVRGWIERKGGPMVEVYHVAAIEPVAVEEAATADPPAGSARRRSRRRTDPGQ